MFTLTCHPTISYYKLYNYYQNCKFSRKILFFEVIIKRHFKFTTQLLAVLLEEKLQKNIVSFELSHQLVESTTHKFYHNLLTHTVLNFISSYFTQRCSSFHIKSIKHLN